VFLERRRAADAQVERLPNSPAPLLDNSLRSGSRAVRLASRFDLFADLACQALLLRVTAPATLLPSELVDILEAALNRGVARRAS